MKPLQMRPTARRWRVPALAFTLALILAAACGARPGLFSTITSRFQISCSLSA